MNKCIKSRVPVRAQMHEIYVACAREKIERGNSVPGISHLVLR
jgi:hypothetical protein